MELEPVKVVLPFSWAVKTIPYPGIHLTASIAELFSANYPSILRQVMNLMEQWSSLPLSWLDRINVIKMAILPKLLYLFRVLLISDYYTWLVQNRAATFGWGSSKPYIPKYTLYLPKVHGGLSFPNLATYYRAAHIASLPKYHATQEIPLWVVTESAECDPLSVSNLLWPHLKYPPNLHNPFTKHFISLWDRLKFNSHLKSPQNPLLSFLKNPAFYPACGSSMALNAWISLGVLMLHKFVTSTNFLPFWSLCETFGLPQSELFRYLQVKNFYTPNVNIDTPLNSFTSFKSTC